MVFTSLPTVAGDTSLRVIPHSSGDLPVPWTKVSQTLSRPSESNVFVTEIALCMVVYLASSERTAPQPQL